MAIVDSQGKLTIGVAETLTPFLRSDDSRRDNDVYVGNVILPGGSRRSTAFVKVFPPEHRKNMVFNEVVAHHLAVQCELPSPLTFPCACRGSLLNRATRHAMAIEDDSAYVTGVASLQETSKQIQLLGGSTEAKWADLMNWPLIATVAVFDTLLGNDDRHIANLIRKGEHEYVLIDNERILFGEPWFGQNLDSMESRRCDVNIIADTIAEGSDEMMRRRMMAVAQHFVMNTELFVPHELRYLEGMCDAPIGVLANLIAMLNRRREHLQDLMQWHLQKGDLFRTSSIQ